MRSLVVGLIAVACVVGGARARDFEKCDNGWLKVDGNCFTFFMNASTSGDGVTSFCERYAATPAKVTSAAALRTMYEYITSYDLSGSFWFGGTDAYAEGNWIYPDLTRVEMGTPFWSLNSGLLGWDMEPSGGDAENCMAMAEDRYYYLDDRDCAMQYHPVCMQQQ